MTLPSMLVVLAPSYSWSWRGCFRGATFPKRRGGTACVAVNFVQLGLLWHAGFGFACFTSRFPSVCLALPLAEGFVGWSLEHFSFYWWHVLRHKNGFWLVSSSPSFRRRESRSRHLLQAPHRSVSDAILSALVMYPLLGIVNDGRVLVQLLCSNRRILLSRKFANTELAEVSYPDTGIAFDTSPIQRSPIQLFGHSAVGPPVWDL